MENIKKRRIIEIIVFLAIVVSSLIVFYPAAKALEKQLVYVRDKLIKTVEDEFEIKITYESISPSFFDRIKIRDVTIYNAATNEKIAHFSLLYIDYRLISLIKKDFTSIVASLGVYDGLIDFNIEKNKNILKKLNIEENAVDKTVKDQKKDESTESSLDISTIIEAGSQKIKNTKPIKLELKNIALNYSNKNSNIDFYTSSGKLTLDSGKIDVYINSSLRYSNFMQTNFPDLSTLININGSFYPGNMSASSILNFSDIRLGNIYIDKFSLFASYLDKIASITTMQDIQPIDVKGSWNLAENAGSINLECNDLKPLLAVSSSEGTDILKELKDTAFTGQFNLTFARPEKLLWDTAFSIKLPKFQIAGNKIEKSILSFKADGTDDLINLKNLKLTNSDINLSAQGSYKIKEILPNFYLNISKFKIAYKSFLIFICCLFSSIGLTNIFNLPSILSFMIVFSFFMVLLLKNKNENKVYYILKKLILFIMFFLIIIWANIKIEINTIKFLSLIATFYFSIDRIFSISKEVTQLIKSESILYYYEHENIPKKILLEEIIEIKYIDKEISEIELVKQILLRRRLNLKDELLELINMYKKDRYTKYLQLVESIKYFIFTKLNELENIKSLKKKIKKIINLKNQKINPIEIYLEYAYILFEINKYFESIKYYEKYFEYLSKEELLRLYEIYIKVNKLDKAKEIKEHFIL